MVIQIKKNKTLHLKGKSEYVHLDIEKNNEPQHVLL